MVTARIGPVGVGLANAIAQQDLWDEYFAARYRRRGSGRLWMAAQIETRHAALDPRLEDVSGWPTGRRMERFTHEALDLSLQAARGALTAAAVPAEEIDVLAVTTCTGYAAPGIDVLLVRELGMRTDTQRLIFGHMGCHAAIPAMASLADAVVARHMTALLVCVEVPSLHLQPASDDSDHLVVHSLFSDAASAVVLTPHDARSRATGWEVVDTTAVSDVDHRAAMTWDVGDLGFRMGISARVPDVLGRHVEPAVDRLLARHDLAMADVRGWAIHPGGPRVLDVCAERLKLDEEAMRPSRSVLRDHGNCSSATVLLVLDAVSASSHLQPGDPAVVLAFGPGLTLYAMLLRHTSRG